MKALLPIRANRLASNFGRCPNCMKQSFFTAAICCSAALVCWTMIPGNHVAYLLAIPALVATLLWLSHIVAHSIQNRKNPSNKGSQQDRRDALAAMARAVGIGIVVSTPALIWPTKVLAFCGQCTKDDDCGVGWSCKNTAAVNEPVCNECVED